MQSTATSRLVMLILVLLLILKAESISLPFLDIESRSTANTLQGCDDCARVVSTPTHVTFDNLTFNSIYIISNGFFSFGQSYTAFSPLRFPLSNRHVVAPYWDDIDLRNIGTVFYELLTRDNAASIVDVVNAYITSHESTSFNANWILVAKWINVCPFGDDTCTNDQPNSFQGLIASQDSSTYAVFTYKCNLLRWTKHKASIGYSAGPNFFANHPLSNTDNVTDIDCINQPNSIWSNIVYRISQGIINVTAVSDVVVALNGANIVLRCTASGYPTPINIQWTFNNVSITNDSVKYSVDSELGTLTIANGMINDAGIYTCIAINSFGSSSATINVSIQVPPVFLSVSPTNITGVLGGNITLSCTVFGVPLPTVNWLRNGLPAFLFLSAISVTSSGNQVTSTLSRDVDLDFSYGNYTCQAFNNLVEYKSIEYSSYVTVTIPPSIELQSSIQNNTIDQFETLHLSCRYQGLPRPHIVWTLNGVEIHNITNKIIIDDDYVNTYQLNNSNIIRYVEGYSNLTVRNVQETDEGNYTCKGINGVPNYVGYPDQRTTFVSVRILASPKFLSVLPPNVASPIGSNVILNCTVFGIPLPTVKWAKNDVFIQSSDIWHHQNYQITVYLSIYNVTDFDRGEYTCQANNSQAYNESTTNLTITKPPRLITSSSAQLIVNESDTFQLSCHFSGLPVPRIVWYHNGVIINTTTSIINYHNNETHSYSVLTVTNVQKIDEGNYTCRGINDVPNYVGYIEHFDMFLTVPVPPSLQSSTNKITTLVNNLITITFNIINAYPPVTMNNILWQFKPINSPTFIYIDADQLVFTHDKLSLIIPSVQLSDRGVYKLIATNEAGTREASVTVDVYAQAVLLNENGYGILRQEGENMIIECSAIGTPQPTIVWRKDGQLLLDVPRLQINSTTVTGINSIIQTTSILMVKDLRVSDSGSYSCKADNAANIGAVLVTPFILQVIESPPINYCANSPCLNNGNCTNLKQTFSCRCTADFTGFTCAERVIAPYPPSIVEGPINTSGKLYSSLTLTCIATGVPFPTIKWYKDNKLIFNNNNDPAVLVISEINLNDRGFYHCQAINTINGVDNILTSPKALVNITDVVQYEAHIRLPDDFYNGDNRNITPRNEVFNLITQSNGYLAGSGVSNLSNASFFFLEILNPDSINYTAKPDVLPIVVTVVTERLSDEQLKLGITQQLAVISQRLTVNISIIEVDRFDGCHSNNYTIIPSHSGRKELDLTIKWPETNIGGTAVVNCPCGLEGTSGGEIQLTASRYCGGDFNNGAVWSNPNVLHCNFSDLAREICQLKNFPADERVKQLEILTSGTNMLDLVAITVSADVLTSAIEDVSGNNTLTATFFGVIDNILDVDADILQESQQFNTSAKLLEAIELLAEDITVDTSEPVIITQRSFAVAVQQVNYTDFAQNGQIFSVNLGNTSMQLNTDNLALGETSNSLSLPNNLLDSLVNISNSTRIINAVFTTDSLFSRRDSKSLEVGSPVIAGTVAGASRVTGLEPPVVLNFQISPNFNSSYMSTYCVYWNFSLDEGYGNWSDEGCQITKINTSTSTVTCECDHLTNFAILLDVSPVFNATTSTPFSVFLDAATYIGLIASILCLIITVISYLGSKKLRAADHGQLLLNLCFALMGLYISFIIAVHGIHSRGFCAFAGALLQYFFLVTFMTMAAEAVNLYLNLVIVLGRKIQYYAPKAIIVCWVTPIFVVLFCFVPSYENYISEHFCRAFEIPFYIGTVVPFIALYIFNWVVFAIIIITLIHRAINSRKKNDKSDKEKNVITFVKQQLVIVLALSFLFGLGWGVGLFATQGIYDNRTVKDIIAAIFIFITAFHGLFIFIMHCLRSKQVLNLWKRWFYRITRKEFDDFTTSVYSRTRRLTLGTISRTNTIQTSAASPSYVSHPGTRETAFKGDSNTLKQNMKKTQNESVIYENEEADVQTRDESVEDLYETVEIKNSEDEEYIYETVEIKNSEDETYMYEAMADNQYNSEDIYEDIMTITNPQDKSEMIENPVVTYEYVNKSFFEEQEELDKKEE